MSYPLSAGAWQTSAEAYDNLLACSARVTERLRLWRCAGWRSPRLHGYETTPTPPEKTRNDAHPPLNWIARHRSNRERRRPSPRPTGPAHRSQPIYQQFKLSAPTAAIADNDIWAVGSHRREQREQGRHARRALRWDELERGPYPLRQGRRLRQRRRPRQQRRVGRRQSRRRPILFNTLIEHWDGASWSVVARPETSERKFSDWCGSRFDPRRLGRRRPTWRRYLQLSDRALGWHELEGDLQPAVR